MFTIATSTSRRLALVGTMVLLGGVACNPVGVDPVTDPNNPSLESVLTNATQLQLNSLAVGTEASIRLGHVNNAPNNQVLGTLAREIIILATNENRWYSNLLGTRGVLDDAAFYNNAAYNGFARTIRASKVFLISANNTSVINAEQKQGVAGFCHTYEALAKLHLLNLMGNVGIRINVDDILKPGPFVTSAQALTHIRQLLDQANNELGAAGSTFAFPLSSGFTGFNTPTTFRLFNRALAARVALYQGDNAGALTALSQSFYSQTAALTLGPKITFAPTVANDASNPYYQVANGTQTGLVVVPANFVTEAEAGDTRLSKAPLRTGTSRTLGGITSTYEARLFSAQTSTLDIIRNEELILISAEAKAKTNDFTGALADINTIRTRAGGLPALAAGALAQTTTAYVDEILRQRRYSLFYEGHLFVDLRRLGRINPNPAPGFTIPYATGNAPSNVGGTYQFFPNLEKPSAEKQWDLANP